MTRPETLAMAVGIIAAIVLVLRDWHGGAHLSKARESNDEGRKVDAAERLRCGSIVDEYRALAAGGNVDLAALRRVEFLHDVASNVARPSEREAAILKLLSLEVSSPLSSADDT